MIPTRPHPGETYPLSAAQRRLIAAAPSGPGIEAEAEAYLLRLTGPLDEARFAAAFHTVVARQPALRMSFAGLSAAHEGAPAAATAWVDPDLRIVLPTLDLSDLPAAEYAAYERRFAREVTCRPFDLAAGPLVRAALLRSADAAHAFIFAAHGLVFDRWSCGVLVSELAAAYHAPAAGVPGAPPRGTYGGSVRAEAAAEAGSSEPQRQAYWTELLTGGREPLDLPADYPRPPGAGPTATVETTLPADLVARAGRAAAARGATPAMLFTGVFCLLLARATGQPEVAVGLPVARRGRLEREALIGRFGETLPLRIAIAGAETFEGVLAGVRRATVDALAHAGIACEALAALAPDAGPGRHPHYDASFDPHALPPAPAWPDGLSARLDALHAQSAQIDLAVGLQPQPDGSLAAAFTYRCDLFEHATIALLAEHYRELLASALDDPVGRVERLAPAGAAEMRTIVEVWSRPDPLPPPVAPPGAGALTIHALVAAAAAATPAAPAVVEDGAGALSYAQLDRAANRLAHALRARGVGRDVRVGLYLDRSLRAVVAMLATLKAGGAYVPLDPAHPPERIAFMVERAGIGTIVMRRQAMPAFDFGACALLDIDDPALLSFDEPDRCALEDRVPPAGVDDPESLAYVMFTSGSTGRPKAVGTTHRGVVALVTKTPLLACAPGDTAVLHASLGFDASVLMWAPLVYGARVAVMPAGPYSLDDFTAQLARHAVTALDVSPALFHALVEERLDGLRGARRVIVGGDVLSPEHCRRFLAAVPECRLFNGYGPTEVTVAASFGAVAPGACDRRSIPVGRPAAEAHVYVLDALLLPVATGIAGEVFVGGAGVARGYLNDPVLTAERFIPDPFSSDPAARLYRTGDRARWLPTGELDFLGRADAQIKLRGFRIEPAEIEFALLDHRGVRHAVAVVRGESEAERRLIAYVEVRDAALTEAELATFLRTKLPAYAVPARLILVDALPKNASGKLERRNLPDVPADPLTAGAFGNAPAVSGPDAADDDETTLARLVAHLLGVAFIARDTDFFAAGGDSLRATRLLARVTDVFGVDISLRRFFAAPSVRGLAALIAQARSGTDAPNEPGCAASTEAEFDALTDAELDALLRAEFSAAQPPAGSPS